MDDLSYSDVSFVITQLIFAAESWTYLQHHVLKML